MNKNLVVAFIVSLIVLTGCGGNKIFQYDSSNVEAVDVSIYNYDEMKTTTQWLFTKEEQEEILNYIENLEGERVDAIDLDNLSGVFYCVDVCSRYSNTVLIADDYAITDRGQYYLIDGSELRSICDNVSEDGEVYEDKLNIMNYRYITLIDGQWHSKFMIPSPWTKNQLDDIELTGEKVFKEDLLSTVNLTLTNNSNETIEFGSKYDFEVKIDGAWYNIDNMESSGFGMTWTDELNVLAPGKSMDSSFKVSFYKPLPSGRYRMVKVVLVDGEEGYVAYEFEVEK